MRTSILLTAIVLSCSIGCSSSAEKESPRAALRVPENRAKIVDGIQIGDPKSKVEQLLGRPMSVTRSAKGTQAVYMFGMEGMMEAMQPSTTGTMGRQLAGTALGMAGALAGPAGGIAASFGSQALEMGSTPTMPDMSDIEMVMIQYQNDRVATIQRQNPGAMMGSESEDFSEQDDPDQE